MATQLYTFDVFPEALFNNATGFDLDTADIRAALLDGTTALDGTETTWSGMSGDEITSSGYTAGGQQLTTVVVERVGDYVYFRADGPSWSGLTATCKYMVIYRQSTGVPICVLDLDTGGSGLSLSAQPLVISWTNNYIFRQYAPRVA